MTRTSDTNYKKNLLGDSLPSFEECSDWKLIYIQLTCWQFDNQVLILLMNEKLYNTSHQSFNNKLKFYKYTFGLLSWFVVLCHSWQCLFSFTSQSTVDCDMPKNIRVVRLEKSFFLFFFFKKWSLNCFSNRFCFFYIQITVQIGNRCGLWGILYSMDDIKQQVWATDNFRFTAFCHPRQ